MKLTKQQKKEIKKGLLVGLVYGLIIGLMTTFITNLIALITSNPEFSMLNLVISGILILVIEIIGLIIVRRIR